MSEKLFDYAIVGAGAAGLHLSLAFIEDPFFEDKSFALIEKDPKDRNDRTWCFWETENTWDDIATKVWRRGDFYSSKGEVQFNTDPYAYKMVRSIDFYQHVLGKVKSARNFTLINEGVEEITNGSDSIQIETERSKYRASHVFDSRLNPEVQESKDRYKNVLQHFKGWLIETKDPVFDPDRFVMMDYRMKWENTTSFMYFLPVSKKEALVEFTFFTPDLVKEKLYDQIIQKYLDEEFGGIEYTVKETEKGDYPYEQFSVSQITFKRNYQNWYSRRVGKAFHRIFI